MLGGTPVHGRAARALLLLGGLVASGGCGGSTREDLPAGSAASGGAAAAGGNAAGGGAASGGAAASAGAASGGSGGATGGNGGSATGGSATGGSGGLPVDDRPPRPEWKPGFGVGEPGWRDSTELLCEVHQGGFQAFRVWADERGVFTLISLNCNEFAGIPCGKEGQGLQFNDGTGWQWLHHSREPVRYDQLTGLPGGPLILLDHPSISVFEDGAFVSDTPLDDVPFIEFFPVGPERAQARLAGDDVDGAGVVREFSSGTWSPPSELPEGGGSEVWADEQTVAVGAINQIYVKTGGSDFTPLPDAPTGGYGSIWGFGPDDLWAGNGAGQLVHYDGSVAEGEDPWTVIETEAEDEGGITQLWGSEGQLYFRTRTELGRLNGSTPEMLITAEHEVAVADMWGLSASEVFVTLADGGFNDYACGQTFIVWFDGTEFHAF